MTPSACPVPGPDGAKGESPGHRPGAANDQIPRALKGRHFVFRPVGAWGFFCPWTRGDAPGFLMMPLWGCKSSQLDVDLRKSRIRKLFLKFSKNLNGEGDFFSILSLFSTPHFSTLWRPFRPRFINRINPGHRFAQPWAIFWRPFRPWFLFRL